MKPTAKPRTSAQLASLKRAVRAEIAALRAERAAAAPTHLFHTIHN